MKRRLVKGVLALAATGAAGVAALLILIELPRKTDQEASMVVSCQGLLVRTWPELGPGGLCTRTTRVAVQVQGQFGVHAPSPSGSSGIRH